LPHFDENVIKKLKKNRVDLKFKNSVAEFCKLPFETIKQMDLFEGNVE
jgi:hypothetical protein